VAELRGPLAGRARGRHDGDRARFRGVAARGKASVARVVACTTVLGVVGDGRGRRYGGCIVNAGNLTDVRTRLAMREREARVDASEAFPFLCPSTTEGKP
jgi:hypothetical protein